MLAEQTSSFLFLVSDQHTKLRLDIGLRVEVPSKEFGPEEYVPEVTTTLLFEPVFAVDIQDQLNSRLFNSVHAGIALARFRIPNRGVEVQLLSLNILPSGSGLSTGPDEQRLLSTIESLVSWMVAATLDSLIVLEGLPRLQST